MYIQAVILQSLNYWEHSSIALIEFSRLRNVIRQTVPVHILFHYPVDEVAKTINRNIPQRKTPHTIHEKSKITKV